MTLLQGYLLFILPTPLLIPVLWKIEKSLWANVFDGTTYSRFNYACASIFTYIAVFGTVAIGLWFAMGTIDALFHPF